MHFEPTSLVNMLKPYFDKTGAPSLHCIRSSMDDHARTHAAPATGRRGCPPPPSAEATPNAAVCFKRAAFSVHGAGSRFRHHASRNRLLRAVGARHPEPPQPPTRPRRRRVHPERRQGLPQQVPQLHFHQVVRARADMRPRCARSRLRVCAAGASLRPAPGSRAVAALASPGPRQDG